MARRNKRAPPRRQPPTDVELDAKRHAVVHGPSHDPPDDAQSLAFDDFTADQCAIIQRGWDETTEWLRSLGITRAPYDEPLPTFLSNLRKDAAHRIPPLARIYKVDRELFEFDYWLRLDHADEPAPDEWQAEVDAAMGEWPDVGIPVRRYADDGPLPAGDAKRLGPALAWQDGVQWIYAQFRADAPLHARKAQRFTAGGEMVLRVDGSAGSNFIRGARRMPRSPPP